jgi:nicotinate-nucleotide adenylyltransferase
MGVTKPPRARIGILGGSFDPVHVGHLALGRAAGQALRLDRLLVVPTGNSWQKASEVRTPVADRLAMVRIALEATAAERAADGCHWELEDIEVRRAGPSYTADTLQALRDRLGPEPALVLVLGSDQLHNLPTWHRWRELPQFAHIAVTQRERVPLSGLPPPVERLLAERGRDALPDAPAGSIVLFRMPPVAVSATGLRAQLARGDVPRELLPPGVADYIARHGLYRDPSDPAPSAVRQPPDPLPTGSDPTHDNR